MELLETRGPHVFGPWTVNQIVEWDGPVFPHTVLFPNHAVEDIFRASPSGANARLTESGTLFTSIQIFVLQRENSVILIDLGTGNEKKRPHEPYWDNQHLPYLETLASLGIEPTDVNYAFISHIHPEHIGLATTWKNGNWIPTFPNAKYLMDPREWEYWHAIPEDDPKHHPCVGDSILPLLESGYIQWIHPGNLISGIRVHEGAGHTPGHLLFEVEGTPLWFINDLIHHPCQISHPEWPSGSADWNSEMNILGRITYFKRFADSCAVLFAEHLGNAFRIVETVPGRFFAQYA